MDGGATATYTYDGYHRRAVKLVGGTKILFFYDLAGRLMSEIGIANGYTKGGQEYLYLHGAPIARLGWVASEQPLGPVLRASKSSSNLRLDWTADPSENGTYLVHRKEVVDPNDRTFDESEAIATIDGSPKYYDDPVLGSGTRYDYRVFKFAPADADTTLSFYHTDHLGTPIAMTDGSSAPVWRAELDPFGGVGNPPSSTMDDLRFPGQYFDWETGLHQNWFRDYDPTTGRYREADPLGQSAGTNLYAYVSGNPNTRIDRLGLDWVYSQSAGLLVHYNLTFFNLPGGAMSSVCVPDPDIVLTAYSGKLAGLNPPDKQNVEFFGPINEGEYIIGPQSDYTTRDGRVLRAAMTLTPVTGTCMHGRSGGYLIHGDNGRRTQSASEGCIVTGPEERTRIASSGDTRLVVVP